jgi:chromosome segregation protein
METHFFKSIMAPGVISTADRLVECAPRFSRLISALLSEVLVVENLEQAFKIKQDHQWQGLIVTLEGEALGKFTISGGKSPAKYPMVGRKRQMENILSEIKKYQQNIEILGEVIKDFHFQISREEKKLEKVKSQHKKLLDELQHLNTNIATLSAQGDAYSSRTREVETEQARIISEKSRLENELTQFQEKQRTLTVEISQTEEKLNEKQLQYREMNREAERKREDLHRKQLNLTSKNGELNNLKADISLSQSRLEELKVEITRYQNTIDAITSKLKEMKTERGRILIEVENYTRLHSQWQEKLYSSEAKQNEIKEQRQGIEGKLKKVALEEEELRREISELEVQSAELKSKISSKEDFALDKFGVDLTAIEPPLASQKSALELELSKLKKKLASIGPVNLLALQEYGKQKERFDFLQSEHQDIFKSKEELLETITKTNSEARARFNKVFEEVANYFKLLFTDLFDGGAGEISLAQGDPLEAEIILRANPAGKKLISLEQLSGGEKALTALALLFSLYQVKPSPFCILDEVDAPLDDANVDRFLKLLHRFAPKTQFILITHNKITMEACDYLYGATMEEDGVTKVVSVELQTSHKIAEAL